MENAVDALKQAAAVLVFIVALSSAIFALTRARQAAATVMEQSDIDYYNTENNIKITSNRIVGIETVIPTLYSYYKEGYTVLFYKGEIDDTDSDKITLKEKPGLGPDITPLTLYYSEALDSMLDKSRLRVPRSSGDRGIYGFDVDDESSRGEPWILNESFDRDFVQAFINNTDSPLYAWSRNTFSGSPNHYDSSNHELTMSFDSSDFYSTLRSKSSSLATASNVRFMERSGTFTMVTENLGAPGGTPTVVTNEDSSTSTFVDENGNEISDATIENEEGTQKRVIQYILLTNY